MNFESVECLPMSFYQYLVRNSAAIELFWLPAQIILSQCFVMTTKKAKERFQRILKIFRDHEK